MKNFKILTLVGLTVLPIVTVVVLISIKSNPVTGIDSKVILVAENKPEQEPPHRGKGWVE